MILRKAAIWFGEAMAGEGYPDVQGMNAYLWADGAGEEERKTIIGNEMADWRGHALHFEGLRKIVQILRGEQ